MIEISKSQNETVLFVEAKGHAGAERVNGNDLLCCAVSTLLGNFELSIRWLVKGKFGFEVSTGRGRTSYKVARNERTELLYRSLLLGLETLESQFPGNIRINPIVLETEICHG